MTEFFPPLDLNDTFWVPWATPKDFAWNAQIVGMGIMVSLYVSYTHLTLPTILRV